jgi:phospholipid/cholesterol/gamma-HCH transport system ATP-binding protein
MGERRLESTARRDGSGAAPLGAADAHVALRGVTVRFGRREIFREFGCEFRRGQLTMLMGGSGSGKTTILRLVGGLLRPQAGSVLVAGEDVARLREGELRRVRHRLGMLFQSGALLDSMTVFENVALPLREHTRMGAADIAAAVRGRLAEVGLPDVEDLLPGELSGGMLRRVGLARALVMDPQIVLCDEPFSGLDPPNVRRIEHVLRDLNRAMGLTFIVTAHQYDSALRIADRVLLLLGGRMVMGTPQELLENPDPRVRGFITGEDFAAADVREAR